MNKSQQKFYEKNRKRNKQIIIRCTEEENEKMRKRADKANMNLTRYMIESALKDKIVIYDMKPVIQMNLEINKIGTNINQIAHKVNTYDLVLKSDMNFIKNQLIELEENYKKLVKKMSKNRE